MAMAFAVAGTRTSGITIRDSGCVSKTYPTFFDDLKRLTA
jgi:3-phosphoshikimate 1-carboxyvinyltransferase